MLCYTSSSCRWEPLCSPDPTPSMSSSLKSRRKVGELQGPRPSHLMIRNETRRIQKPARKPVVIYMVSPKIIHVEASEFMALVQRLTGPESSATDQSSPGTRRFPVRVKARVLTHSGSESGAISTQNHPSLISPVSPMHGSSPLSSFGIGARKEGSPASQSWLLRGDYSGQSAGLPSGYVLGSPDSLDIYHQ